MDGKAVTMSESLALTLTKQQPNNGLTGALKAACPSRLCPTMARQAPVGENTGEVFTQINDTKQFNSTKMAPENFSESSMSCERSNLEPVKVFVLFCFPWN